MSHQVSQKCLVATSLLASSEIMLCDLSEIRFPAFDYGFRFLMCFCA